jgi:hypothetical protein
MGLMAVAENNNPSAYFLPTVIAPLQYACYYLC